MHCKNEFVADKCQSCRDKIIKCANETCNFKRSEENKYCKKHQIHLFLDETYEEDKKTCVNYIRGCRTKLDMSYGFTKCQECLKMDRENDHKKRNDVITTTPSIETNKICSVCCKEFPKTDFNGDKGVETKTCKNCRESFKRNDLNRDKEHRLVIARKNDKKPERIAVKNAWKEANYEKVAEYCMNSREKRIETLDVDEYLNKNAEQSKEWRERNPEKCKEINENKKNNIDAHYSTYRRTSNNKNIAFELSETEFQNIVKQECYYCGLFSEGKQFNGIDKKIQTIGYTIDNCVPCCDMCNYMKKSLNNDVFLERIEHILTYNDKMKDGNYYPDAFANHFTIKYSSYKSSANKKQLNFEITENEFQQITQNNCYICGKEPTQIHKNGIDRTDNDKGSIFENCKPCCGECNFMKNNYNYNDFMEKIQLIYHYYYRKIPHSSLHLQNSIIAINEQIQPLQNTNITTINEQIQPTPSLKNNNIMVKTNKKTQEQIKQEAIERKRKQRQLLKEKYGDKKYKKIRAAEIAEYRKKTKETLP
jgi:hypothetical protein